MGDYILTKWWQKLMYIIGYISVIWIGVALVIGIIMGFFGVY